MSEPAVKIEPAQDIEAEVNEAITICGGDVRAALRATLVANAFLERRLEEVLEMTSAGYGRGKVREVPKRRGDRQLMRRFGLPLP